MPITKTMINILHKSIKARLRPLTCAFKMARQKDKRKESEARKEGKTIYTIDSVIKENKKKSKRHTRLKGHATFFLKRWKPRKDFMNDTKRRWPRHANNQKMKEAVKRQVHRKRLHPR